MRISFLIYLLLSSFFPLCGFKQFKTLGKDLASFPASENDPAEKIESATLNEVNATSNESTLMESKAFHSILKNINIISSAGWRQHPVNGQLMPHNGIVLKAYYETVYALMDSVVEAMGYDTVSANWIRLRYPNGMHSSYAHLGNQSKERAADTIR
jgi:murein DD-endopeptidase MepM/ murein hydrolase activator NlpD